MFLLIELTARTAITIALPPHRGNPLTQFSRVSPRQEEPRAQTHRSPLRAGSHPRRPRAQKVLTYAPTFRNTEAKAVVREPHDAPSTWTSATLLLSSVRPNIFQAIILIRPRPLPSKSLPVYHSTLHNPNTDRALIQNNLLSKIFQARGQSRCRRFHFLKYLPRRKLFLTTVRTFEIQREVFNNKLRQKYLTSTN